MGGQSSGNFSVVEQGSESYGLFQGTVRNVSFLHAPGFCRFTTVFPGGKHENAAEFLEGGLKITLRHRHAGGHGGHGGRGEEYQGFKVAVSSPGASHHHGGHELFGMYKANFNVEGRPDSRDGWLDVLIPFRSMSSDWSDFTGECATKDPDGYQHKCCETGREPVCPNAKTMGTINGFSIWAEGTAGDFALEVKSISAVRRG